MPVLSVNVEKIDLDEFRKIFDRHYPVLCRLLTSVLGSRSAAEDVAQEAFIRLYKTPPREFSNVAGWLTRVATNLAYNHLRSEKSRLKREACLPPLTGPVIPDEEVLRREQAEITEKVLNLIPERDRACLLLKHAGMNYSEIARAIGVKEASVGTLLARARVRFKAEYMKLKGSDSDVL